MRPPTARGDHHGRSGKAGPAAVGEQKAKLGHAARGNWALGVQPQRDVVDDVLRGNDVNGIDLGTHRP
jgi:hypothetical protein